MRHGTAGLGRLGGAGRGVAAQGVTGLGKAGEASRGVSRNGLARRGMAWKTVGRGGWMLSMKTEISLGFCLWLQSNFDAVLECLPVWHRDYRQKPEQKPMLPVAIKASRMTAEETEAIRQMWLQEARKSIWTRPI